LGIEIVSLHSLIGLRWWSIGNRWPIMTLICKLHDAMTHHSPSMHNSALQIIVCNSWILPTLMQCFERLIEWSNPSCCPSWLLATCKVASYKLQSWLTSVLWFLNGGDSWTVNQGIKSLKPWPMPHCTSWNQILVKTFITTEFGKLKQENLASSSKGRSWWWWSCLLHTWQQAVRKRWYLM
jgi:hypothetical protein